MADGLDAALDAISLDDAQPLPGAPQGRQLPADAIVAWPLSTSQGPALYMELGIAYDTPRRSVTADIGDTLRLELPTGITIVMAVERTT